MPLNPIASHTRSATPWADLLSGPDLRLLAVGESVGEGRIRGRARFIRRVADAAALQPGEIALLEALTPAWTAALSQASGLLVNADDAEARAVADSLGVPAVLGALDGASPLWSGAELTLIAEPGAPGRAYQRLARRPRSSDAPVAVISEA